MSMSQATQWRLGGYVLVLLQFGLLGWLGFRAWQQLLQALPGMACLVPLALSGALGGWTLLHNRPGNFNIHPEPKGSGELVTSGPYRLMRHPMYTTVLLAAAAMACAAAAPGAWFGWLLLSAVLLAKASLEERWLSAHYSGYANYCRHSKRLVPWLF